MARADLLLNLVRTGSKGDQKEFRKTVEALIAEERAKHHHVLANQLSDNLSLFQAETKITPRQNGYTFLVEPQRTLESLLLAPTTRETLLEVVEEHHRRQLLQTHGLEPRHRILLTGPPGNGKTSLAEAMAYSLNCPLMVVRYETVIGSYLGETASRLSRLFDEVRQHRAVLFFDEFDTLGKERGDEHETGEVKRVVSSLLLQVDALPSHNVVVAATNHPELLDRAVWRRFEVHLDLPNPSRPQRTEYFARWLSQLETPVAFTPEQLAGLVNGRFSDLEQFCLDVRRRAILSQPPADYSEIIARQIRIRKVRRTKKSNSSE